MRCSATVVLPIREAISLRIMSGRRLLARISSSTSSRYSLFSATLIKRDVQSLGDRIGREEVAAGLGSSGIGHMGAHAGEEHQFVLVEDRPDEHPVRQMYGAIHGVVGQIDISGLDLPGELLSDSPYGKRAGDQPRRESLQGWR